METVFREALEYKRDQLADQQSRPPFDIDENKLINAAMARVYGLLARTGSLNVSDAEWERALSDPTMSDRERSTFLTLAREYRFQSPAVGLPSQRRHAFQQYPVAPRFVVTALHHAGLQDTPDNRRVVLSVMASAYQQAFQQANDNFERGDVAQSFPHLPEATVAQLTPPLPLTDESGLPSDPIHSHQRADYVRVISEKVAGPGTRDIDLIDLRTSELAKLAIETHTASGDWQDSAQRNAKVIADIFIAENGDLRMSEIEAKHVVAVRRPNTMLCFAAARDISLTNLRLPKIRKSSPT